MKLHMGYEQFHMVLFKWKLNSWEMGKTVVSGAVDGVSSNKRPIFVGRHSLSLSSLAYKNTSNNEINNDCFAQNSSRVYTV